MALEIRQIKVEDIVFGEDTRLSGKTLLVNEKELTGFLKDKDDRIRTVAVSIARPGESTRIICVKDVLEPQCKISGKSPGEGSSLALKNTAVVTSGQIVGYQEGIIEMSGPGAAYSPFSRTLNIILEIGVAPEISQYEHEETLRTAGLRAADFLAQKAVRAEPDLVETIEQPDPASADKNLPRIAYLYLLLSQGLLHDTYVLGRHAQEGLPRSLPLQVLRDRAIVSGNCVSACDKNTTWHHQNNPVLQELYLRHSRDLNFVGTVLSNEPIKLAGKQESAEQAVELIKGLEPHGVVISKEGFGNPDADLMMLIRRLEKAGIRTAAISDEYAGSNGASQSLADTTPEADAVISTGNANEVIVLPPVEKTIGPVQDLTKLAGAYPRSLREDGSLEIEIQGIIGATNETGAHTLRCREI
ncbi:MAG: glycine/sarcosine/betaine reductase component B subunit [Desulfurivibrionaceae bacterium]